MKFQCDVCNKESARVFCFADEAALCHGCDRRVHCANKLAGKHQRFPLDPPPPPTSSKHQSPLCDICKERRAFLFCQEDRAILCQDCDAPIHSANDLTAKHSRFLLSGIKFLAPSASSEINSPVNKTLSDVSQAKFSPPSVVPDNSSSESSEEDGSVSNISDYLINTLPGWHVDELLNSSIDFPSFDGFYKMVETHKPVEASLIGGDFRFGGDNLFHNQVVDFPQNAVLHQYSSYVHGFDPGMKSVHHWSENCEMMRCFGGGGHFPEDLLDGAGLMMMMMKGQTSYGDGTVPQVSPYPTPWV